MPDFERMIDKEVILERDSGTALSHLVLTKLILLF